ncbi:hypothetical protein [Beijerinckia sp. L45]|uniref:hypothetical protein n=1 Tax=Beijerinckia sp. L45 TaxID=1641855 RepID=UPI00131E28EE|nr:hypothetical protein [Beijerinckia sp. L45]
MSLVITPYEGHRRRVRWMEAIEAERLQVPIPDARDAVARATSLTPSQLENIRKGKLKDLYGGMKRRIDLAFIAFAQKEIGNLGHELLLAEASARGVDPSVVEKAQASIDALEQLIAEARAAGITVPPKPHAALEAPSC